MPRFYLSEVLSARKVVPLPDNVAHHLHVLRLKLDEEIVSFNGDGKTYPIRLGVLGKCRATAEILCGEETDNESPLNITLIQVASSSGRMDFTL